MSWDFQTKLIKRSVFPVGSCDTAAVDGRSGSYVYEVNLWLWQFGRGKPRLGGLSVEKIGARKKAAQKELLLLGAETSLSLKADLPVCARSGLMGNEVSL